MSELAYELSIRGQLVVSMTTDGLITDCPLEKVKEIESPLVNGRPRRKEEIGLPKSSWIELKGSTEELLSWKTRGQHAVDHGEISALAGIQKPKVKDYA